MTIQRVLIALFSAFFLTAAIAATPLDRIVVVVNNTVITQSELNQQIAIVKKNLQKNHIPLPKELELQNQILSQMIDRELQLQLASRTGIRVSETELNQAIETIANNQKQTPATLYTLAAQDGLSRAEFREQIKNEVILHKLQQRDIANQIVITDEEVAEYLKSNAGQALNKTEYHLTDILIPLPNTPTAEEIASAKAQTEQVIQKLKQGENFSTIAASLSKGKEALQGGDLGWKSLIELPSSFAENLANLKTNDIAGPIRTPNGFHIIKVLGTRLPDATAEKNIPLNEQVRNILFEQLFAEKLQAWINELRAGSYIHFTDQA